MPPQKTDMIFERMRHSDFEIWRWVQDWRVCFHLAHMAHCMCFPLIQKNNPSNPFPPHLTGVSHSEGRPTTGWLVASCPSLALSFLSRPRGRGGRGGRRARHHEGPSEVKRDRRRERERERARRRRGEDEKRATVQPRLCVCGRDRYSACLMLPSRLFPLTPHTSRLPTSPSSLPCSLSVCLPVTVCDAHHKPMCRWTPQIDVPQGRPQRRALRLKPAGRCC
ncbi:hypothetical protein QBC39DRAFT_8381 [Podospora conica]|nr:hypothetical protein QBC39DRAFT_8381 [Schizothecium conicum]